MNNLRKCLELLEKIDDEEVLKQLNKLLESLSEMPLKEQTKILEKIIRGGYNE